MSIEIRQLLIKSQVVQRHADGQRTPQTEHVRQEDERDWRAECRRLFGELLDERRER